MQNTHVIVIAASALLFACSSSSSSGGSTGTTNTGSDAGSTGATKGSGSSGLPPGVTAISCYEAAKKNCDIKGESTQSGIDMVKSDCTTNGGTVEDHCPTADLVGCCIIGGLGSCTYDASMASSLMNACMVGGGTYTMTPP